MAKDTRLDRTVAIKLLPAEVSADPERRVRFEREARAIASLADPHICTLYDVGEHNGSAFLVMAHLAGETLAARLEKSRLPLEQTLNIASETADALSAARRQGIIHRDLKPGSVMLTSGAAGQTPPSFVRKRRSWRFTAAVILGAACLTVVGIAVVPPGIALGRRNGPEFTRVPLHAATQPSLLTQGAAHGEPNFYS